MVVELVAAPTKRRFANRASTNVDDLHSLVPFSSFSTVVPDRLVARRGSGVENNSLKSLLKALIFGTAHINIVCYISKTETRMYFCGVHVIYLHCSSYQLSNIVSIDFIVDIRHQ